MVARSIFALLSLFFTAGALLLMFLILLAGAVNHSPVNKFYFLQASTHGIPGAPAISRWTFWNLCPVTANGSNKCGAVHPAFPLDPPSHRNFDTTTDVPKQFLHTGKYFYLTRFMFAFMLITMFFAVCALFTGVLAMCTRIGSYLSGLLAMIALFFQTLMASLMSAAYVIGRDNFRSNKQTANIGKYAFGFEWAAWACLLISTALFCAGGSATKKDKTSYSTGRRSFFGGKRSKSTRSRGSFIDGGATKEYA